MRAWVGVGLLAILLIRKPTMKSRPPVKRTEFMIDPYGEWENSSREERLRKIDSNIEWLTSPASIIPGIVSLGVNTNFVRKELGELLRMSYTKSDIDEMIRSLREKEQQDTLSPKEAEILSALTGVLRVF
jgi:hypothetical protein